MSATPNPRPTLSGRIYLAYAGSLWLLTFLLLFPFFFLAIQLKSRRLVVWTNRVWCVLFFYGSGIPWRTVGRPGRVRGPGVVVSHHASYFDIPVMTAAFPTDHVFMGKGELGGIPLFGYMYRKLHILVNRKDPSDRKRALARASDAVQKGRLLMMFPEGRIHPEIQPGVSSLHDGAFYLAVQHQVPLIPVTMPYNWRILPDNGTFTSTFKRPLLVCHPAIPTQGLTEQDIPVLKEQVARIFADDLARYNGPVQ